MPRELTQRRAANSLGGCLEAHYSDSSEGTSHKMRRRRFADVRTDGGD